MNKFSKLRLLKTIIVYLIGNRKRKQQKKIADKKQLNYFRFIVLLYLAFHSKYINLANQKELQTLNAAHVFTLFRKKFSTAAKSMFIQLNSKRCTTNDANRIVYFFKQITNK